MDAVSFISSPIFKVVVSTTGKEYSVHKDLLASASKELEKHVYNEMNEGKGNSMTLQEVGEETVERFLEWLYTGSYSTSLISQRSRKRLDVEQLLSNARLYIFADRFNIPRLCNDILTIITMELRRLEFFLDAQAAADIVKVLEVVVDNLPQNDRLLEYVVKCVLWMLKYLKQEKAFWKLIRERPGFAELVILGVDSVNPPPWTDQPLIASTTVALAQVAQWLERPCPFIECRKTTIWDVGCCKCNKLFFYHGAKALGKDSDVGGTELLLRLSEVLEESQGKLWYTCFICRLRQVPIVRCNKYLTKDACGVHIGKWSPRSSGNISLRSRQTGSVLDNGGV